RRPRDRYDAQAQRRGDHRGSGPDRRRRLLARCRRAWTACGRTRGAAVRRRGDPPADHAVSSAALKPEGAWRQLTESCDATTSAMSSTGTLDSFALTPSLIIVMQNGQATAMVS